MPRIPETEIARIKTETDLVALIQSRGVALKQQGENWIGLCPFHGDKDTPNLRVIGEQGQSDLKSEKFSVNNRAMNVSGQGRQV